MKLLLDTHAFIWWAIRKERLSPTAISLCGDGNNEVFLSIVSLLGNATENPVRKAPVQAPAGRID